MSVMSFFRFLGGFLLDAVLVYLGAVAVSFEPKKRPRRFDYRHCSRLVNDDDMALERGLV